jgi:arsenate reductase-like glutaredoxin family protein
MLDEKEDFEQKYLQELKSRKRFEKFSQKLEDRFKQVVSEKKKTDKELKVLSELNEANEASLQQIETEC